MGTQQTQPTSESQPGAAAAPQSVATPKPTIGRTVLYNPPIPKGTRTAPSQLAATITAVNDNGTCVLSYFTGDHLRPVLVADNVSQGNGPGEYQWPQLTTAAG